MAELDAVPRQDVHEPMMHQGGAELALEIIADQRHASPFELTRPVRRARDDGWDAIDKPTPGSPCRLRIPLRCALTPDREKIHHDMGVGALQVLDHVVERGPALHVHPIRCVVTHAVAEDALANRHPEAGDVGEFERVVRRGPNRFGKIAADLGGIDIESGCESDVRGGVAGTHGIRQSNRLTSCVRVIRHPLNQRGGAVSHSNDTHIDGAHLPSPAADTPSLLCGNAHTA